MTILVLQWGRDREVADSRPGAVMSSSARTRFNGAATARSRIDDNRLVQNDETVTLQWGRDREVADRPSPLWREACPITSFNGAATARSRIVSMAASSM